MFCPSCREGLGGKGCTVCAQVGTRRYQNPAGFGHYPQLSPGEMGWMKHRCLIALQSLSSPVQTWFQQRVVMRKVKMARTNTSWASNKMCAVRWGDLVSSAPATRPCASVHSVCGALCSTPPPCSKAIGATPPRKPIQPKLHTDPAQFPPSPLSPMGHSPSRPRSRLLFPPSPSHLFSFTPPSITPALPFLLPPSTPPPPSARACREPPCSHCAIFGS